MSTLNIMLRNSLLALLLLVNCLAARADGEVPVGTNLNALDDWSTEIPFVDVFKTSRPWLTVDWQPAGPNDVPVDARGWVTSLPPGQVARTLVFTGQGTTFPEGQYVLTFEGEGTFAFSSNVQVLQSSAGRQVLQVIHGQPPYDIDGGGVGIYITAVNPANHLRNIHLTMPVNAAPGEMFNPTFLARARNYKCLRFMLWMLGSEMQYHQRDWADRPLVEDARWNVKGAPIEVMCALANRLGANPWFSIPHEATDDYVTRFASTVKGRLDPSLTVYIEHSNEVFNTDYPQAAYAMNQGIQMGLGDNPDDCQFRYNALRSRQIFGIFEGYFPHNHLVRVIGGFSEIPSIAQTELAFRDTLAHTDALAIAPYFGYDLGTPDLEPTVQAMWPDHLDDLFALLQNVYVPHAVDTMHWHADIARANGISLIAYEGGQHMANIGSVLQDAAVTALFDAANRDPRMGTLYTQYLEAWVAAGGGLFENFNDCGAYGAWTGRWGALEYVDEPRAQAPKYDALMRWLEAGGYGSGNPQVAPAIMNPAPGSTLLSSSATLSWTPGTLINGYRLSVGSVPGGNDLFDTALGMSTSAVVNGLPTDGRALYARLSYHLDAGWRSVDTRYTAALSQVPPTVTSPAPGSTLASSTATFAWSSGTGVTEYWLTIGSTVGAGDLFNSDMGMHLSATVSSLPTDGRSLYVHLCYQMGGRWQSLNVVYSAANIADGFPVITSPMNGARLTSPTVRFTWTTGRGVTQYWLYIGTAPGRYNVLQQYEGTRLTATVGRLPLGRGPLYVRLWYYSGSGLRYTDAVYQTR